MQFEGVRALEGVEIALAQGEIVGLIGPNGAGKTTLVNVLSGFQRPASGTVRLQGRDVTGSTPEKLARSGLARTFQGNRLFPGLTAFENLEVAALRPGVRRREAGERARTLLELLGLSDHADMSAGALPQGVERRIGVARAVALDPQLVMLDEPAAGLNESECDELVRTLRSVRAQMGIGMLVIEHDMRLIMGLCDRIHVLDHGRTLASGSPDEVRRDPEVLRAYLGDPELLDA